MPDNEVLKSLFNEFNPKLKLARDYNEFATIMSDENNRKDFFNEFNSKLNLAKDYKQFDEVLGLKKKDISQRGYQFGSQTSPFGSKPSQAQVPTEVPSVLLSDEQKQQQEKDRIGKRFETTLLNIPTELGRVAPAMKAAQQIQETLPEKPKFRKIGEIPRMQPTAMTEGERLGESLTEETNLQELTTDKFTEKKTGLQKQIENAENAFISAQGEDVARDIKIYQENPDSFREIEPRTWLGNAIKQGLLTGELANTLPTGGRVPTPEDLSLAADINYQIERIPQSEAQKEYQKSGLKVFSNPLLGAQFLTETIASSLASLYEASKRTVPTATATGAGAGAFFGGIGALPGAGLGASAGLSVAGLNLSTSGDIMQSLKDSGVDITNKDALIKAFSNENKMSEIRTKAVKYGVPILVFDMATAGIAGKLIGGASGKSIAKKISAGLGEAGIQSVGGASGELAGQVVSGKPIDWNEVAVEGIASLATDAPDVAIGALTRDKSSSSNKNIATQINKLGSDNGSIDAKINLDRDLANGTITPDEYQQGIEFIGKALAANEKIPAEITSDIREKSIELIAKKDDILSEIKSLNEEKSRTDDSFHQSIDEKIKAKESEIEIINQDIQKLTKEDAVQVETAGQVPVLTEATVGEEVEQGKPKSETEVVTEEGAKAEEVGSGVEAKRIETETKIKRKDLFEGVGQFSTELGGSDKAAVPVSHKEINGIEFVEYAHPETGSVDVIVTGKSDNDFVGFYRIYENGKPTNKWSSKFENQSRKKEDFKTMIGGVQEMLPQGHEYIEKTSISTDGLRVWNQQLSKGYELQYDKNGKLITNLVAINGDAISNELGIPVEKGEFENIKVKSEEEFKIVKKALLPYLEKLGLGENDVRWLTGTVKINLPVLKSTKSVEQSLKEQTPAQQVKQLRAEEQAELNAAIPNADQYLTDGKVDEDKLTDPKDKKAFNKIYDKYDKLITPLLPEKETKTEEVNEDIDIDKISSNTGIKAKNLRDLYNINRKIFSQDRIKSLASAIVMDRMIGAMAKRAGVSKGQIYNKIYFKKATPGEIKSLENNSSVLFQANYSDDKTGITFSYDKNTDKFNNLKKERYITDDKNINDFSGQYIVFHKPDYAFSGDIVKNGKIIVEGQGGIYYPIKFHEDGLVWAASSERAAKAFAKRLNESAQLSPDGKVRLALVSSPNEKVLSSYNAASGIVDVLSSNVFDEKFGLNEEIIKSALIESSNSELGTNITNDKSLKEVVSIIKQKLEPENIGSIDKRRGFIYFGKNNLLAKIAENIKDTKNIEDLVSFFGDGIANKDFVGKRTGKLSRANLVQAFSYMFNEPMLRDVKDSDLTYAVIEVPASKDGGDVVTYEKNESHKSYPYSIVIKDKSAKTTLNILSETSKWNESAIDPLTNKTVAKDRMLNLLDTMSGVSNKPLMISKPKQVDINWEVSKEGKGDPSISSRNPIVEEAAKNLKEGKITNEEHRATVHENSPIGPITRFFEPATDEQIKRAFEVATKKDTEAELINEPIANGTRVASRLDIPSYNFNNTWVVAVHDGSVKYGKIKSYRSVAKIKNVVFGTDAKAGLNIAAKVVSKTTIARMYGDWVEYEGKNSAEKAKNAKAEIESIVNDKNWVQGGMNPFRHSYFYDRSSDIGRPILEAEEVVQIGGLVYVKNPKYGNWTDEAFAVKNSFDSAGNEIRFQDKMGAIITQDSNAIIYALTDPNISTPLHEMAHAFEHYLTLDERKDVLGWANTNTWTKETSEKFARGFEKYLSEGKAPTPALQKIFNKFKEWLTDIYNGIVDSEIDIELNEKMRSIYSSMLGKDKVATKLNKSNVENAIKPIADLKQDVKKAKGKEAKATALQTLKENSTPEDFKEFIDENPLYKKYEVKAEPIIEQEITDDTEIELPTDKKDISKDRLAELEKQKKELFAKIRKAGSNLNTGFSPEVISDLVKLGAVYIEEAIINLKNINFSEFSAKLKNDYGKDIPEDIIRDIFRKSALANGVGVRRTPERIGSGEAVSDNLKEVANETDALYQTQNYKEIQDRLDSMSEADKNTLVGTLANVTGQLNAEGNVGVLAAIDLINMYEANGDKAGAKRVFDTISKSATAFAQLLRQYGQLKSSTPQGYVSIIEKHMLDKYDVKLTDVQKQAIEKLYNDSKKAIDIEADALNNLVDDLTDVNYKLWGQTTVLLEDANRRLADYIESLKPATAQSLFQKLTSEVQGNLLSLKSLLLNPVANAAQAGIKLSSNEVSNLLDFILSVTLKTGRTKISGFDPLAIRLGGKAFARGLSKANRMLMRGATATDLAKIDVTGRLKPVEAWKSLYKTLRGKQAFEFVKTIENLAEGTIGVPANLLLRLLPYGDLPRNEQVKIAKLIEIGRNKFGLKGNQLEAFTLKPDPESLAEAELEGDKSTLQEPNKAYTFLNNIINSIDSKADDKFVKGLLSSIKFIVRGTIVPFLKTPINYAAKTIRFTNPIIPYSQAVYHMVKAIQSAKNIKNPLLRESAIRKHQSKLTEYLGEAIIAQSIMSAALILISNGLVTGDAPDEEKEKNLMFKSLGPNMINISGLKRLLTGGDSTYKPGDTGIAYNALGVLGAQLGISSNTLTTKEKQNIREKKFVTTEGKPFYEEDKGFYLSSIQAMSSNLPASLNFTLNQGFAQGAGTLLTSIGDNEYSKWSNQTVKTLVTGLVVPNTVYQSLKAGNDYYRNVYTEDQLKTWSNIVKERYGNIEGLPINYDMFGKPIKLTPEGSNPYVYHVLDIFRTQKILQDKNTYYVFDLYKKTNDKSVIPSSVKDIIDEEGGLYTKLTPDQQSELQRIVGEERAKYISGDKPSSSSMKNYDPNNDNEVYWEKQVEKIKLANQVGLQSGKRRFEKEILNKTKK